MAGYTLQVSVPPTRINNKQSPCLTSSFACSLNPSQIEQTAYYFPMAAESSWILTHYGVEFGPGTHTHRRLLSHDTCLTQAAFVPAPVNHSNFRLKHGYQTGSCLGLTPYFCSASRSWPLTPALWTAALHRHLFIQRSSKKVNRIVS